MKRVGPFLLSDADVIDKLSLSLSPTILLAYTVRRSRFLKSGIQTERSELTEDSNSAPTKRPYCPAKLGHPCSAASLQDTGISDWGRLPSHPGIISFVLNRWSFGTAAILAFKSQITLALAPSPSTY